MCDVYYVVDMAHVGDVFGDGDVTEIRNIF